MTTMRIALLAIGLLFAFLLLVQASAAGELRIAAWNLEHLKDSDGEGCVGRIAADYAAIAGRLDELDADIVALQEVENAAAAHRVFRAAEWRVEMSPRPPAEGSARCRQRLSARLGHLATGFAIRKGIVYHRNADSRALGFGSPYRRWGTDITARQGERKLRLLSVHLISGCWGARQDASGKPRRRRICNSLHDQMRHLKRWRMRAVPRVRPPSSWAISTGDWPLRTIGTGGCCRRLMRRFGCWVPIVGRAAIPDTRRSSTIWSPAPVPRRCWSRVPSGNCRVTDGIRITAPCLRRSESADRPR